MDSNFAHQPVRPDGYVLKIAYKGVSFEGVFRSRQSSSFPAVLGAQNAIFWECDVFRELRFREQKDIRIVITGEAQRQVVLFSHGVQASNVEYRGSEAIGGIGVFHLLYDGRFLCFRVSSILELFVIILFSLGRGYQAI